MSMIDTHDDTPIEAEASPEVLPLPARRLTRRNAHTTTPEQNLEILNLYLEGEDVNELAAAYKVHMTTIYEVLKRQGVRPRDRKQYDDAGNVIAERKAPSPNGKAELVASLKQEADLSDLPPIHMPSAPPERGWWVTFTVTRRVMTSAPTIEEALRMVRAGQGPDIDILEAARA